MNKHFEKIINNEFAPMSYGELIEYSESPEGKYVAKMEECNYRRGYWDGVNQALQYLEQTTDKRQVEEWLWNELKKWRYDNPNNHKEPPKIIPWSKLRKTILDGYNNICAYCGNPANQVDHVIPVARGGTYELDNLVAACKDCNRKKWAYYMEEVGMEIKFYPIKPIVL